MFSLPGLGWQRVPAAGWCWLIVVDVDVDVDVDADAGFGVVAEG